MATPKRKMKMCLVQIGCEGNDIPESSDMCSKCRETIRKRQRAGTTDARHWQVRPT